MRAEPPPVREPRISQGHVIKGSCDIVGRSPSRETIILPSLVAIDTLVIYDGFKRYGFCLARDLARPHDQSFV